MRISVAVPTLNSGLYLGRCLESILTQCVDVEVLIQDGGSTDNTMEIARHFAYHYPHSVNISVGHDKNEPDAINKAFESASGDIMTWLDSDDVYVKGSLPEVGNAFKNGAEWVYGKCRIIDEYGTEIRTTITKAKELFQKGYRYQYLQMVDFIPQPATFFSRKAWEVTGVLNVSERLVFDYDYWLRLGGKYQPAFIDKYLACWRAHNQSISVMNIKKEALDAKRIARGYTHNPVTRMMQNVVYCGTLAVYGSIK